MNRLVSRYRTACIAAWALLASVSPSVALAAGDLGDTSGINVPTGTGDIKGALVKVINFVLSFVALLAVIAFIVAGIRLIISQGDDSAKESAKKGIIYAIVGIVVIALAALVVNTVIDFF
ncbi:MAG: hypothetical protein PHW10_00330 [Candidatus Peribacteraceae bacterium]|nr:hypothetical protein [Candidatus Peribacteraceae bacterium]